MNPEKFYPWSITESALDQFLARVTAYTPPRTRSETFMEYIAKKADEMNGLKIHGGRIAVQPVQGVIAQGCGPLAELFFGCFDLARIDAAVEHIAANSKITALVLDINSPGGYTQGMPEAIAALTGVRSVRPGFATAAYAVNADSAGYWLAASMEKIHAAPGASLGSIGTYAVTRDSSAMFAQAGVKVRLHADGKFKGMFTPGVEVKPEWLAWIDERVTAIGTQFKSFIKSARPTLAADHMEGQPFDPPYPPGLTDTAGQYKSAAALCDALLASTARPPA